MNTKETYNHYRHIQESYMTDIDLSGGMLLEFQERERKNELSVTVTNFGRFYKGTLNGKEIKKEELFAILGITEYSSLRLEHYLYEFDKRELFYNVNVSEIDVT